MPDLTLTGLRVVYAVARTGSFTAAAELLGYTQSAVSRQVAATEAACGSALFRRHARGVRPTAAGDVLLRHAARIMDNVAAADQELLGLRDRLAGRLVVGGFPTAMAVLIPQALARLSRDHPALEIRLSESSTPAQLLALRRGRLEVAVIATGTGLPNYDLDGLLTTELRSDKGIGVAVAASHPFTVRESVTPDDLADQPWVIGASAGSAPEFGAWPGLKNPKTGAVARAWTTRLGLVAAEVGIALIPGIAADAMPSGVRWIPVQDKAGGLGRTISAVTGQPPSSAASAMVGALAKQISTHR